MKCILTILLVFVISCSIPSSFTKEAARDATSIFKDKEYVSSCMFNSIFVSCTKETYTTQKVSRIDYYAKNITQKWLDKEKAGCEKIYTRRSL